MDRKSSVEIWRDIKDYPNYQISNLGRVKSLKYGKERILKCGKDSWGYLQVNLWEEGKTKRYSVHRLVAQAFLPNPNNLSEVNHKNEIKTDNRIDNLEWCTITYNNIYGTRTERASKSKSIPILQFSKEGNFVRRWESGAQAEKELGIDNSSIAKCCRGKYKSVRGYKWGYADDYEKIPFRVFDLELYRKAS